MDISLIVNIGLPVLVLTGSLQKVVANTGTSKRCFVLFFACTAIMSLLPTVRITQDVWINLSGAFFCTAPALYLALKKAYNYRFFIIFSLVTLAAVLFSFVVNSYSMPYLAIATGALIAVSALVCCGARAPVFAPVLAGVFFAVQGVVQITTGIAYRTMLFGDVGMAATSAAACLFAAYVIYRPRGRHAPRAHKRTGTSAAA